MFNYVSAACAAVILAASGATEGLADSSAFDGIYKPLGAEFAHWDCNSVGEDGGAISIMNGELRGVESYCKLTNPVNVNGMSGVLFDSVCAGEGYEWKQRAMLMRADFGVYYITDEFVAEWQNCKADVSAQEQTAGNLVRQWQEANGFCRGGSGSSNVTLAWCEMRGSIDKVLDQYGWCYGKIDQASFEKSWHECGDNSLRFGQ